MLYAWTLTRRDSADETTDTESFWTFIDHEDFLEIKDNAFSLEDFLKFVDELKLAGEMLRVTLPNSRLDHMGNPTTLLNTTWEESSEENLEIGVYTRHIFDLKWLQRVGECLREEIRTPRHAYVFADYVAEGFRQLDPDGFASIVGRLLYGKSPFALIFSEKNLVKETNGFEVYEPFQIALAGFMANLDRRVGSAVWDLQRLLFYSQPSGDAINTEKQCLSLSAFLDFATPLVTEYVNKHEAAYFDLSTLVEADWIPLPSGEGQFHEQLIRLMQSKYGHFSAPQVESVSSRLLFNAVAFFTLCCVVIKSVKTH